MSDLPNITLEGLQARTVSTRDDLTLLRNVLSSLDNKFTFGDLIKEVFGKTIQSDLTGSSFETLRTPYIQNIIDQQNGYRGGFATNSTPTWLSTTTYTAGATVKYTDKYWFSISTSNLNNTPSLDSLTWLPCPTLQYASALSEGLFLGGFKSFHDPYFGIPSSFMNFYKQGEFFDGTKEKDFYVANIAGQLTGDATTDFQKLIAASKHAGIISSSGSTLTAYQLYDYRGHFLSSSNINGGSRSAPGVPQDSQNKSHRHGIEIRQDDSQSTQTEGTTDRTYSNRTDYTNYDGGDEAHPKNVADGCLSLGIFVDQGTISVDFELYSATP